MRIRLTHLLLIILIAPTVCAQAIVVEKVTNEDLIYLLNRIEVLGEVRSHDLSVRILQVSDIPGSAGYPTSEVTHTVYIAVSGFDELPEQSLFRLSGLLAPSFSRVANGLNAAFILDYGEVGSRNRVQITPSLEGLEIQSSGE